MRKLACILAMSLMLWPACTTEQNKASQNENKETESARQQRRVYQAQIEAKLRELDHEIDALTKKLENANSEDRASARQQEYRSKAEQQMAELDRKRDAARRQLDKMKDSGPVAWQDMKGGIDAAMQNLQAAYDRAASKFK